MTEEEFLKRKKEAEQAAAEKLPAAAKLPAAEKLPAAKEMPAVEEQATETLPPAAAAADAVPADQTGAAVYPTVEAELAAAPPDLSAPPTAVRTGPTHEEEEIRVFWREYGREQVRGSVRNIDGVGRQLIAVDGVLVGLYAHAIAFGGLRGQPLTGLQIFLYLLPVIFLLLSLIFAGGIFFLDRIPLELRSSKGVRGYYMEAAKNKMVFLRTSMLLLALAVVAVIGALWVYLSGG